MPRAKKKLTHEQVHFQIQALRAIKAQLPKQPLSKSDIAKMHDKTNAMISSDINILLSKGWVMRRTGPIKAMYFKISAKGNNAIKAWDLLFE